MSMTGDLTALPCTGESSSSVPSYITFVLTLKATVLAYALKPSKLFNSSF